MLRLLYILYLSSSNAVTKAKVSFFSLLKKSLGSKLLGSIVVSFIVASIGLSQKAIFCYIAPLLGYEDLYSLIAILLIRPLDIIRCNLLKIDDSFRWIRFLIPLFIIVLLVIATHLGWVAIIKAEGLSFLIPLLPWNIAQHIITRAELATINGKYQMATAGGVSTPNDGLAPRNLNAWDFLTFFSTGGSNRRRFDPIRDLNPMPEPARVEPAQAEPAQVEPAQAEPAQVESAQVEPAASTYRQPWTKEQAKLESGRRWSTIADVDYDASKLTRRHVTWFANVLETERRNYFDRNPLTRREPKYNNLRLPRNVFREERTVFFTFLINKGMFAKLTRDGQINPSTVGAIKITPALIEEIRSYFREDE